MADKKKKNVKIVVLGDIGRSPRMQYHAVSLAEKQHKVDIISYGETQPSEILKIQPLIFYHYLVPVPVIPIRLLNYIFKTIFQSINLLFLLMFTTTCDVLLVQNPPAIPSLIVCWFYSRIVNSKFIIDWHNYAYTIMTISNGNGTLSKITLMVERFIGRRSDHNFCVTNAMKKDLHDNWGITATTLYDRPPSIFHPLSHQEKVQTLQQMSQLYDKKFEEFIEVINGEVNLKQKRPGLLISSTSWTEDEDFSVLLSALEEYENHCIEGNQRKLPLLVCVITGKGPLKNYYQNKILELNWKFVTILTPWFESDDYPKILACANLGVSLHTSSSGLDLPMKVVDMFGCGLPVCALDFKCLNELVKYGKNGYLFSESEELATLLIDWFDNFPNNSKQQWMETIFKTELDSFQKLRWKENWEMVASNYF